MADPAIVTDPFEVSSDFARMDLDRDLMVGAVRYADAERTLVTKNDPKGFDLILMNAKVARALRETFAGDRWEWDETDNQPGIRNPHLRLRIIPCNFNRNTCNPLVDPTNRYAKGDATRAKCNATAWLPGLPRDWPPPLGSDGYITFVLGTYFKDDEPLRAELSRPESFWGGHYRTFSKRYFLLDGSESSGVRVGAAPSENGPTGIVEINVRRK